MGFLCMILTGFNFNLQVTHLLGDQIVRFWVFEMFYEETCCLVLMFLVKWTYGRTWWSSCLDRFTSKVLWNFWLFISIINGITVRTGRAPAMLASLLIYSFGEAYYSFGIEFLIHNWVFRAYEIWITFGFWMIMITFSFDRSCFWSPDICWKCP